MVLGSQTDRKFNQFIIISIAAHILLVFVLYFKNTFFISKENVEIKNAIQVDVVALPDKAKPIAKPAPKPKPKPIPKPKKKTPPKPKKNQKKLKQKQSNAIQKLKALSAIEKIKKQQEAEEQAKKLAEIKKQIQQDQLKKGNVKNETNGLSGLDRIKMNEFYLAVKEQVHANFFIPSFLKDKGFNTKVRLKIDSLGNIISKEIYASSGNDIFDEAVLTSIDKSSPLPAPPDRLKRRLEYEGFVLGFPE